MAEEGLRIKIGADVSDLNKGLATAQTSVQNFGKSVNRSVPQATQAFTNLGRVVQDAPFGFIGIQNNIEPLIQSFQQLKASTGSTGGALKALAGSLMGGGGLLLGFSLVTSAITIAVQKYGSLGNAAKVLFGTQTELDRALIKSAKSYEEFNKAFRSAQDIQSDAGNSVSGEIARVNALVKVIDDETIARGKKVKALSELKAINKDYFGDLTLESIKLTENKKKIEEYNQSIVQAAIVKAFQDDIGKLAVELDRQEKALGKAATAFIKVGAATTKAVQATKQFGAAYQDIALSGESGIQKDFVKQVGVVGDLRIKYKELTDGINSAVSKQLDFIDISGRTNKEGAAADAARLKAISAAQSAEKALLQSKLVGYEIDKKAFEDNFGTLTNAYKNVQDVIARTKASIEIIGADPAKIAEVKDNLEKALNKIAEDFKEARTVAGKIEFVPLFELDEAAAQIRIKELIKSIQKTGFEEATRTAGTIRPKITIIPSVEVQSQIGTLEAIKTKTAEVTAQFNDFLAPAIQTVFGALQNGQSIPKALAQSFKALLVSLAATIVKAAILAAILAAITGGGSLAAGSAGGKGFATIFKGLLGLKETASPQFGGIGNGGLALSGGVRIEARGTDLVGVISGSNARIGRVG